MKFVRRLSSGGNLAEQQLRALADMIPQLAWMASSDGSVLWFNRRWHEFTGLTTQPSADQCWHEAHHPEHVDRVLAGYRRAVSAGAAWEDTFPLRGRNGSYRWFLARAVPIRNAGGRIERWFGTNTDVTDKIEATERLRESEARFRALVDASPLGIDVMDMDGQPIFFNPKCAFLHGIGLDEARGDGWMRAVHPEDRQRIVDSWRRAWQAAQPWAETYRFQHANGRVVWISGRAAPMHIDGQQVGYVGTLEDITELKAAEAERERLLELKHQALGRAERATQLRDEILGIVAHDLRNPLHTLAILARRMLRMQPAAQDDPGSEPQIMLRTVDNMARLISDLLDVSTIEAGRLAMQSKEVDMRVVLQESLEAFEGAASERNIALACETPERLPAVLADQDRLAQAMSNLLGNAIKFTPAGGEVRLGAAWRGDAIHVCVSDTGPGIPAEDLAHIFDRFWQARQARRAGAGLGLAITKGIIEAHGGRIWADSTPGRGTRMSFSVPVAPGSADGS